MERLLHVRPGQLRPVLWFVKRLLVPAYDLECGLCLLLVLQRQFREGCGVMPAWRRGAWHGSVWPVRYCPAYPQATAATRLARTVPGAAFPAPPGRPPFTRGQALRPRDPGHLFPPKPVAGSAEKLRPAGTGPRGDASQPRCGSRTRPGPTSLFSVSNSVFNTPTGASHVCQGLQRGNPPEHWTGSSGVRCRPGSGGRRPSGFRRACACWSVAPSGR